ncbi:MAG TPA: CAP domain-containing protein [Clostridium sp.]
MKKTLRALILTLGILVTTGISSAVYAQDCNTLNYRVEGNTINYTIKAGDSLQQICSKYGIEVPKGLAVKSQATTPTEATPAKATPTKTAAAKAPTLTENNKLEKEVVTLVNQERAKQGLAPLKENVQLSSMARTKSEDMVAKNYFDHTSPTYGSPFDMMKTFGITYTAAGENIAMGQQTAASVMSSWMNSPGHKANILSKDFTEIGVGVAKDKSGAIYWTQEFIGK